MSVLLSKPADSLAREALPASLILVPGTSALQAEQWEGQHGIHVHTGARGLSHGCGNV